MIKTGIYPGTFDPITNGHIDVVKRSLKIVDKLFIAVSNDYSKDYLFSAEERVSIIKNSRQNLYWGNQCLLNLNIKGVMVYILI